MSTKTPPPLPELCDCVIKQINNREFALARHLLQEVYDWCAARDLLAGDGLFGPIIREFDKGQFDRARTLLIQLRADDDDVVKAQVHSAPTPLH